MRSPWKVALTTLVVAAVSCATVSHPSLRRETLDPPRATIAWATRYAPAGWSKGVSAMAVSPEGSTVYITGSSRNDPGTDIVIIAYDASDGSERWNVRVDDQRLDNPTAIGASPDGKMIFVTAWTVGGGAGPDDLTIALNAQTGVELWRTRVEGGFAPAAIEVDPNGGRLYLSGSDPPPFIFATAVDFRTVAIDSATGGVIWSRIFMQEDTEVAFPTSMALSAEGDRVFVTAYAQVPDPLPNPGTTLIAYDTGTGAMAWQQVHAGYQQPVVIDPNGQGLYLAGNDIIALDHATGDELWRSPRISTAFTIAPDGRTVYAMGLHSTAALDSGTGEPVWITRSIAASAYPGNSINGMWMTTSPDGRRVYQAGGLGMPGGRYRDRFTLGTYRASTGERIWRAVYRTKRAQFPGAFGATPNVDFIFVAGRMGYQRAAEFLTVAFSLPG